MEKTVIMENNIGTSKDNQVDTVATIGSTTTSATSGDSNVFRNVKFKGKRGTLHMTPTVLLFRLDDDVATSIAKREKSWKWTLIQKHMVKSVAHNRQLVKILFVETSQQPQRPPILLEVVTIEQLNGIKKGIAAFRRQATDTITTTSTSASPISITPARTTADKKHGKLSSSDAKIKRDIAVARDAAMAGPKSNRNPIQATPTATAKTTPKKTDASIIKQQKTSLPSNGRRIVASRSSRRTVSQLALPASTRPKNGTSQGGHAKTTKSGFEKPKTDNETMEDLEFLHSLVEERLRIHRQSSGSNSTHDCTVPKTTTPQQHTTRNKQRRPTNGPLPTLQPPHSPSSSSSSSSPTIVGRRPPSETAPPRLVRQRQIEMGTPTTTPGAVRIPGTVNQNNNDNLLDAPRPAPSMEFQVSPPASTATSTAANADVLVEARLVEEGASTEFRPSHHNDMNNRSNNNTHNNAMTGDIVEARPLSEEQDMRFRDLWKNRRMRWTFFILLCIMLAIGVGIAVGLTLSLNKEVENRPDANSNTSANSTSISSGSGPASLGGQEEASSEIVPITNAPSETAGQQEEGTRPPSNNNDATSGSGQKPSPGSGTYTMLELLFNGEIPESTVIALEDSSSPQSLARRWLHNNRQENGYVPPERQIQQFALVTFYYATNGDYWTSNHDNWLLYDENECTWSQSVPDACPPGSDSMTSFALVEAGVTGSIPPEFFLLTNLEYLDLSRNYGLQGTLPTEATALTNLKYVDFSFTEVSGSIPEQWCSSSGLEILVENSNLSPCPL